jgi:hypothetical protein
MTLKAMGAKQAVKNTLGIVPKLTFNNSVVNDNTGSSIKAKYYFVRTFFATPSTKNLEKKLIFV